MCCFATFLVATLTFAKRKWPATPNPSYAHFCVAKVRVTGRPKKRNYFIGQVVELVPAH